MVPKIFEVFGIDKDQQEGNAKLPGDHIPVFETIKQETSCHHGRNDTPVKKADLLNVPPFVDVPIIAENTKQPKRYKQVKQARDISKLPKPTEPGLRLKDITAADQQHAE